MKTIRANGEMIEQELYGQLSETGKPFNEGYVLYTVIESKYFASGEEILRDKSLKEMGCFDEDTPDWESLHEEYGDSFYYSEWNVEDGMDGGYDIDGNYYLYNKERDLFIEEN